MAPKKEGPLKGLRTIIFNVTAAIPILIDGAGVVLNSPELRAVLPVEVLPYYSLAILIGNIFLRSITTTPIGKSK